jgi:hypothetical protein
MQDGAVRRPGRVLGGGFVTDVASSSVGAACLPGGDQPPYSVRHLWSVALDADRRRVVAPGAAPASRAGSADVAGRRPEDYAGRRPDFGSVPQTPPAPPDTAWTPAPDGGMRSRDGRLAVSAEQYAQIRDVRAKALVVERRVTPILLDLERRIADSRLVGLDSRLKTVPSLCDKFLRFAAKFKDEPVDVTARRYSDSVRYTVCIPFDGYVEGTADAMRSLAAAGYEPTGEFNNTWGCDSYRGVNSLWKDPDSGVVFEVQFHTPESFWAKQDGTHDIYEEQRRVDTPRGRKLELQAMQDDIFKAVPIPPGARELSLPIREAWR